MAVAQAPLPLPAALGPRGARRIVLGATLVCAICGFAYELVIVALGTVLFGSSTEQTALVLGTFVAAMGLGSWAAGRVPTTRAVEGFVAVECAVALAGGLSALGLFAAYAWLDLYAPAVRIVSVLLGALVGAEIPLLVSIVGRLRSEAAGRAVGTLLAADYVGAFAVGLAFPLVILPALGQVQAALAFGAVNALGGAVVLWLLRGWISRTAVAVLGAALLAVLAGLGVAAATAGSVEASARQALYDDPIVAHVQSRYQDITLTESLDGRDVRLFLNGDLQFSSVDERRYHEALVHPVMAGRHDRVLVLGGGDGLALREVLRYRDVRHVTVVELDPAVVRLARERPELRRLNGGAFADPRVEVVNRDAFSWSRGAAAASYDVVLVDLPDPDSEDLAKLYSVEQYGMLGRRVLAPGGRLVVQAGSPWFAPEAFWCIERTVAAAGLATRPYHVDVPSFGDWGYVLAQRGSRPPALGLDPPARLATLDAPTLRAAATFAPDRRRLRVRASTLDRPSIVRYSRRGWRDE
ncbi:polyamine aminopropyltransferase [Conexibacter sp. SYSU D00693]|uniref:polyamine aminopropyltransferase n=1 Tax=Conexibacter sp. SYSU D00693 TaxID=2812560 RepID=UPI00196A9B5B|nr:polyamine aminopropyltransferase [Conexibacter sp. SYSU D00693]